LDRTVTDVGETLDSIGRTAGELVDSMSDIVWAINPRHDALDDLAGRMRRFASDLLTSKDIAFRFQAPERDGEIHLPADVRREVFLTFKEGLHNIVRHSKCTEAAIALRMEDGSLELTISDNGVGFNGSGAAGGHGLASLAARAASLRGVLDVRSEPGRGMSLCLRLPLRGRPHILRW
jgi:signal transduction histidine kinase